MMQIELGQAEEVFNQSGLVHSVALSRSEKFEEVTAASIPINILPVAALK